MFLRMPGDAEKLRIVLVEDDRDLADVIQAALEFEGLDVAVAHDGREGLDLIDRTHPDVVITDLVMPVLDGLQLIQRLFMQGLRLPVIAVSAVGSRLHAARELGAVEALVKPVEPKELAAVARKAYRRAHV
ncbi:MAG: response regulator [Deltaproteobacteria bacterium]|nr:MAG: response regulator [Deltaproteobacteria bacterium]